MARRKWAAAVTAAAAGLLAGCSGDSTGDDPESLADASSSTATATPSPADSPSEPVGGTPGSRAGEEATASYTAWLGALARGDAEAACSHHAPEFTIELRQRAILVDRAELGDPCSAFVALLWEDPAFESEIVDIAVTQATEEDALLAVTLARSAQTVRMVHHRAQWRVLDTSPRVAADDDAPAGAEVDRWLDAWCDLDPGMGQEEIVGLMGPPSGEYTVADGGEPQLWWALDQYDFRVYLDADGTVLELVGDYDALTVDDRDQLPCPELRS